MNMFEDFDITFLGNDRDDVDDDNDQQHKNKNHCNDRIGDLFDALMDREYGFDCKSRRSNKIHHKISHEFNPTRFRNRIRDSLYVVKNMSQSSEMFEHLEPIYSIDFNQNGQFICSSGDDCKVSIWNWSDSNLHYVYDSDHDMSVNCCRWSPVNDDQITTCGDDGFVRCAFIDRTLITKSRVTCCHDSTATELVHCDPCVILSVGLDGQIFQCDHRQQSSFELLRIRKKHSAFAIKTIDCNLQIRPHLFAIGGHGSSVLVYDRRYINDSKNNAVPYQKYCLSYLAMNENDIERFSVPCVRFNPNGDKLLCSTSTGELVVTDLKNSPIRLLAGQGVKLFSAPIFKCCWFSDRFAFSSSNDGFLYAWNIEEGSMIFFKIGDEIGNVNAISAHPMQPILATAGSNRSVKIWSPLFDEDIIDYGIELIREKIIGNFRARFISNTYHKTLKDVQEISYLMSIRNLFEDTTGEFWRSHHQQQPNVDDNNEQQIHTDNEALNNLYADLYEFFVVNAHHFP